MYGLTAEDFEPWVGKAVRVGSVPAAVEVTLVAVRRGRPTHHDFRLPFTLLFESPANVLLLDGTYEFDCGRGGPHSIYINQVFTPAPAKRVYQAAFN